LDGIEKIDLSFAYDDENELIIDDFSSVNIKGT